MRTISRTTRHLAEPHWDALVKTLAECHIVTVARLEAERDAAVAARDAMERRNLELVTKLQHEREALAHLADTAANLQDDVEGLRRRELELLVQVDTMKATLEDAEDFDADIAEEHRKLTAIATQSQVNAVAALNGLADERRLHAATAASLSQAEVRVEELSAELAAERAAKVAAREQRDRAIEVACTCIDGETLDDLLASGPVILPPCPLHPEGKR